MCRRAPGAFNDANGIHRLRNRPGCTFPHLSRDPRPVGSQPPFGVGQSSNPYPVDYRPAFASSDLPYPLTHRRALTGHVPPSLRGWLGLPRCTRVPILKDLGPALPPAVQPLRGEISRPSDLTAYLLVHAYQPLGHVASHDVSAAVHMCWPYPSTPAPDRREAGSRNVPSRFGCPLIRRRLQCPERFAPQGYPQRTAR
jgi:hypothetical protein